MRIERGTVSTPAHRPHCALENRRLKNAGGLPGTVGCPAHPDRSQAELQLIRRGTVGLRSGEQDRLSEFARSFLAKDGLGCADPPACPTGGSHDGVSDGLGVRDSHG